MSEVTISAVENYEAGECTKCESKDVAHSHVIGVAVQLPSIDMEIPMPHTPKGGTTK